MMSEKEDQKNGDKRTETTMIISQRKERSKQRDQKQRDQNKESKKLGKDTHSKEDDSEKTMFTKSM